MNRSKNSDPVQAWMRSMKKKLKKKAFKMKLKFVLSVVLPGAIVLLGTATARIFLRMTLRKAGSGIQTAPDGKKHKEAEHADGILAWPEHKVTAGTEAATDSEAESASGPADAAETPPAVSPEPVALESAPPEFVMPEAVETEIVNQDI